MRGRAYKPNVLAGLTAFALSAAPACAETLRIATFHSELSRPGPGLLLADILERDPQTIAAAEVIAHAAPDAILITGIDWDGTHAALTAFQSLLAEAGHPMPYVFARQPNAGMATGLDLDGNGRVGEARDSQGYGRFTGQGGMAILSRLPLGAAQDFSTLLWQDLPGAIPPENDFPSPEARAVQRLSSVGHWDVELVTPSGPLHLLAFNATTPVFDGPEDLNGRRNHDEIAFWSLYLSGTLSWPAPEAPVVLLGNANLDPVDGEGRHVAITALLTDPDLQDPQPASEGARLAATPGQTGDPALDTADWDEPTPGNLRVDYVLPDARLTVTGAGTLWPVPDDPFAKTVTAASRHRLVWVDIDY